MAHEGARSKKTRGARDRHSLKWTVGCSIFRSILPLYSNLSPTALLQTFRATGSLLFATHNDSVRCSDVLPCHHLGKD